MSEGKEKVKLVEEVLKLQQEYEDVRKFNKLSFYDPYPFQAQFHQGHDDGGKLARQRCLMAGNKTGKTFCGAAELAYHLTGLYPDWWDGWRFDQPIQAWAAGQSHYATRDIVQCELLGTPGDPDALGTAAIPKELILSTERNPGVPNGIGMALIKHVAGKSRLQFKSYDSGPTAWMGVAVDVVWMDEEPPQDIYSQSLRASLKNGGPVYMTFTPERGVTGVVQNFLNDRKSSQQLVTATWDDAKHLSEDVKEEILAALPLHERQMRSKGIPVLGSGQVFPIAEESFSIRAFEIPDHWPRVCGIDFGFDHPTAAVWVAWDRDTDTAYLYDSYCQRGAAMLQHAEAIKLRGSWIPVAWPHDGSIHDKGSGHALADQYRRSGVNFLGSHFLNPEGGMSIEPGIMALVNRFQTGRLKVFDHLQDWFKEYRIYHRKDGKIVKKNDDLMSATRYAVQSLRYSSIRNWRPRLEFAEGSIRDTHFDPFSFWRGHEHFDSTTETREGPYSV